MVDQEKMKELDSHWKDVMDLAIKRSTGKNK